MFKCTIQYDNKIKEVDLNKMVFFDELYIDAKITHLPTNTNLPTAKRLQLTIHPKEDVTLQAIDIQYGRTIGSAERIFCNGFQSWSESREFNIDESIPKLRSIAHPFMGNYGDNHIPGIQRGKGYLHSWTYTYIRHSKGIELIGSLSEQAAFTLIQFDTQKGIVHIQKEIENLKLTHSFPVLDIVFLSGEEQRVFDAYFELMKLPRVKRKPAIGWTSWYHYYTNISAEIILQNLEAFQQEATTDLPTKDIIFQIDDGYQKAVGDWLRIKPSFPNGMRAIAQKIHQANYLAGIWLAPFICEKKSELYQKRPDWLLRDSEGKLVKAGYNPSWSGHFFILDFYNPQVQEYLTGVFHTVLHKWDFDVVKLDFLYAVCIVPRPHKSRGKVMYDAMQFIRNQVGEKRVLACGVPLGSAFGLVDYCRIGADIHLKWEHGLLKLLRNRERVSTILALRSVVGRWQLNGRAFINDPDVFILRDKINKLTPTQQYTILVLNALLGDLLFTSDYLADYSAEQESELNFLYYLRDSQVKTVTTISKDQYKIVFTKDTISFTAYCNLQSKPSTFSHSSQIIELEGYETLLLRNDKPKSVQSKTGI